MGERKEGRKGVTGRRSAGSSACEPPRRQHRIITGGVVQASPLPRRTAPLPSAAVFAVTHDVLLAAFTQYLPRSRHSAHLDGCSAMTSPCACVRACLPNVCVSEKDLEYLFVNQSSEWRALPETFMM
ncbi:hypothetical protein E2C01_028783 [Portunus trituberculatus]|uniref:Uncharacterized protein n=1 Tax=Portunus trituberculatus TaxID=210409 RepID=A0A5B7ELK3_PORTR|nr:hypothetical protein [Portunus trituberculatus]